MQRHVATDSPKVLTVDEVADHLRLSTDAVRKLLQRGEIPGMKIGSSWRIPKARFDAFLDGKVPARTAETEESEGE